MDQLRPFVASQRLYESLLTRATPPAIDAATPFHALCADVLGARRAYLVPLGPLSSLAGPMLAYPPGEDATLPAAGGLAAQFTSPDTMYAPVDPALYGGALWAVPLWSERGLIGVLLLGDKSAGGVYTQEEIEIARASGERLIDTQASAEIAGRLMVLQRRRLAESQVLDRRARRALHDDVLPRLHTAILNLSSGPPAGDTLPDTLRLLADVHRQISNLLREMPTGSAPEVAHLGLIGALQQTVHDELGAAFDAVTWEIAPEAGQAAEAMPALTAEVVFYAAREAIRNAARHGRAADLARPLRLRIAVEWRNGLEILIEDDGVGLGAPPAPNGGSGQGLALHGTMMAVVGGALAAESVPGRYTRVMLTLPQNAAWVA
jgi:signal transduction histidine kinase